MYMLSNKTRDLIKEKFNFKNNSKKPLDNINVHDLTLFDEKEMKNSVKMMNYENSFNPNIYEEITKTHEYHYLGESSLNPGKPVLIKNQNVNICIYSIQNEHVFPYLEFCLERENNNLSWLSHKCTGNNDFKIIQDNLNNDFDNLSYKGFYNDDENENKNISLWFNIDRNYKLETGKYKDKLWWCLACELINQQYTLSFNINENIANFCIANPEFLILKNDDGDIYETPSVGYYGNYYKRIAFTSVFGHMKEPPTASLGPYYYFGSYKRAIRYAFWTPTLRPMEINDKLITIDDKGLYDRGGLVKFALFLGKTNMLLNRDTDLEDDSQISLQQAENSDFIKQTLKIRDSDGKWVYKYNSMLQGKVSIETKSGLRVLEPQIIVKDYNQQIPLAYYYIDTTQDVTLDTTDNAVIE